MDKSCLRCAAPIPSRDPRQKYCSRICWNGALGPAPIAERFWRFVAKGEGCWEWSGGRRSGYGRLSTGHGKGMPAHRFSWELHNGPIPDGLHVLHHCDNPPCVRPDHLFLGTAKDNMRDRERKGRARRNPLRGEANPNAKLNDVAVREIRSLVRAGHTEAALARRYGVDPSIIADVVAGRRWRHVA